MAMQRYTEDGSNVERCYHGNDALSAVVTVTTTPAKDRLAYTLNIVRPYDPDAPAAAASSAAAPDVLPGDDGAVSVGMTPPARARIAEMRQKRKERRESRRRGRRVPAPPAGPTSQGPTSQEPAGQGPLTRFQPVDPEGAPRAHRC